MKCGVLRAYKNSIEPSLPKMILLGRGEVIYMEERCFYNFEKRKPLQGMW